MEKHDSMRAGQQSHPSFLSELDLRRLSFEKLNIEAIYIEFSKAFDKVSHQHLLAKMKWFGIVCTMLQWFRSYLTDRILTVRFASS